MNNSTFLNEKERVSGEQFRDSASHTNSTSGNVLIHTRNRKPGLKLLIHPQISESPVIADGDPTSATNPSASEELFTSMNEKDLVHHISFSSSKTQDQLQQFVFNIASDEPITSSRVSETLRDNHWILKTPEHLDRQDHNTTQPESCIEVISNVQEQHSPQPTNKEEKNIWFWKTLSQHIGLIYAILMVTSATSMYVADALGRIKYSFAEGFNVYMMVVQLIFLLYLHIDYHQYTILISTKRKAAVKEKQTQSNQTGVKFATGGEKDEIESQKQMELIPQPYGFTSGRHAGSLYLKIGATVFCFGYMIQAALDLGEQILYQMDEEASSICSDITIVIMNIIRPIYVFYNLFFIYKYSNIIINRRLYISKLGIMHCIGSSLCFWIYYIIQETMQTFSTLATTNTTSEHQIPLDDGVHINAAYHKTTNLGLGCEKETELSGLVNALSPYTFPFSIEFNILMLGCWIILWENLGRMERHTHIPSIDVVSKDGDNNNKSHISNIIIYVDCHASLRGLFSGLLLTVAIIISIILFYVFSSNKDTAQAGSDVNCYSEMVLLFLMLVASIVIFYQLESLDVITHPISLADDILLFTCLPLLFLYAMACAIPYFESANIAMIVLNILQIIQAIVQTVLIIDGLRRCSNSPSLQNKKPGREMVMFLMVTNITLWLLQSFQIKIKQGNADAYDFYGVVIWTTLSHFTLPFVLFYRFNSSVCLANIWMEAYTFEEEY